MVHDVGEGLKILALKGERRLRREARLQRSKRWYYPLRSTVLCVARLRGVGWGFLMMVFVADLPQRKAKVVLVVEWKVWEDGEGQRTRSRWPRVVPVSSSLLGPRAGEETGSFLPQGTQVAHL